MADKKKIVKITSPKGVAVYPKLTKPDTKFKAEGEYSIKLKLPQEAADALVAKLTPILEDFKKTEKFQTTAKKVGLKKVKQLDWYKDVNDDEGNATGDVEMSFKAKASGKKKDGTEWKRGPVAVFDAKGTPLKDVQVWGGSEVKVSFSPMPWINPKGEYGVKLGLEAVQVLRLVSGGNRDASDFGFGEEEGFTAEDEAPADGAANEGGTEGEGTSGDDF